MVPMMVAYGLWGPYTEQDLSEVKYPYLPQKQALNFFLLLPQSVGREDTFKRGWELPGLVVCRQRRRCCSVEKNGSSLLPDHAQDFRATQGLAKAVSVGFSFFPVSTHFFG